MPSHGLHPWASIQVTAAKVVLADPASRTGMIGSEDVGLLLTTQRPGEVWEGNLRSEFFAKVKAELKAAGYNL